MGTNYYLHKNECEHCGRYDREFIGKSSGGWRFLFRGHNPSSLEMDLGDIPLTTVEDWREKVKEGRIIDEYGKEKASDEFWELVESKQKDKVELIYGEWVDPDGYYFLQASANSSF